MGNLLSARDIVSTRRDCQLEIAAASVKKNGWGLWWGLLQRSCGWKSVHCFLFLLL